MADTADDVQSTVTTFTQRVENAVQKYVPSGTAPTAYSAAAASIDPIKTAATTFAPSAALAAPAPQPRTSVVPLVTNLLGAVLHPLLYPGTGDSPPQLPTLMMVLAAVRDEVERIVVRRPPPPAPVQTGQPPVYPDPPADPTKQHVLVVAIDGTNMNRVLADPANDNFFDLMDTSTVSAPSIVGHTTVSNPSWTAILTGAWDNKTGVVNNVFTPWTYDRFPSVFTQLETSDPAIKTKAIADWDVIAAISDSGVGADD
ncbi:MAG: phosphodiesterase, partial [Mycobacterium sp.]